MPNGVRFLSKVSKVSPLTDKEVSTTQRKKKKKKRSKRENETSTTKIRFSQKKKEEIEESTKDEKHRHVQHHEKLKGMDSYIYSMTSDENSMIITGALLTKGVVMNRQAILDRVKERVVEKHERFRCTIVDGGTTWKAATVDLSYHVKFAHLDRSRSLREVVTDHTNLRLDMSRPPWQVEFISDWKGEVVAIVFRVHHVIGDGLSMMLMLYSLLDDADASDPYKDLPLGKRKVPFCLMLIYILRVVLLFPFSLLWLLFMRSDQRNVLHRNANDTNYQTQVFWSKPVSLKSVKTLRKRARCSVNDLFSAVVAGALRRYFLDVGESVEHDITSVIPVSVRRLGTKQLKINNQVSSVFLRLPISVSDPIKRLKKTKKRMDGLKYGAQIWAVFFATRLVAMLPRKLALYLNDMYIKRCSLIFSNVPGKTKGSGVLDNQILGILGVVPGASFGVTCVTYDGNCFLTVTGHSGMPRVELIAKYFNSEFLALQKVFNCQDDEDPVTQLQLRQEHAGWLRGASERSDIAKGLVPVYDVPALPSYSTSSVVS